MRCLLKRHIVPIMSVACCDRATFELHETDISRARWDLISPLKPLLPTRHPLFPADARPELATPHRHHVGHRCLDNRCEQPERSAKLVHTWRTAVTEILLDRVRHASWWQASWPRLPVRHPGTRKHLPDKQTTSGRTVGPLPRRAAIRPGQARGDSS